MALSTASRAILMACALSSLSAGAPWISPAPTKLPITLSSLGIGGSKTTMQYRDAVHEPPLIKPAQQPTATGNRGDPLMPPTSRRCPKATQTADARGDQLYKCPPSTSTTPRGAKRTSLLPHLTLVKGPRIPVVNGTSYPGALAPQPLPTVTPAFIKGVKPSEKQYRIILDCHKRSSRTNCNLRYKKKPNSKKIKKY